MNKSANLATRFEYLRRVVLLSIALVLLNAAFQKVMAHASPNSLVFLNVSPQRVVMELQLPVPELELAFKPGLSKNPETIIEKWGPQLREYLLAHIHAFVARERPWAVSVDGLRMDEGRYPENNLPYWEVIATVSLTPAAGDETRNFHLDYDVILHQVANHAALVSVRGDWENGIIEQSGREPQVIAWDMTSNKIPPLQVSLEKGSWWNGFSSMVKLGMRHIAEGTDHLMFLLVLLLPATLLVRDKRWSGFGGTRYSMLRLLKIVTAFTIGHSLTLILGALGLIRINSQVVEVLIAVSILVSAIHAIRPLFPGKEMFVAAGFGLIHGMAFATTLTDLRLGTGPLVVSVLGFNIGIELMQLFIIAITIPWLVMLSKRPVYIWVRVTGAIMAAVAAIAWIDQRLTGQSNFISGVVEQVAEHAQWLLLAIIVLAVTFFFIPKIKKKAVQQHLRKV